ncbi:MAG TPA: hypothetical protein VFC31_00805 [Candidatus Limnocylindria bacterium]|nr:hypothetical protein [Candidatus Limnocylindria bacterium]
MDARTETSAIDAGLRAWYASCRCCLSDGHPEIVDALDAERAAKGAAPSGSGTCEAAETAGR